MNEDNNTVILPTSQDCWEGSIYKQNTAQSPTQNGDTQQMLVIAILFLCQN